MEGDLGDVIKALQTKRPPSNFADISMKKNHEPAVATNPNNTTNTAADTADNPGTGPQNVRQALTFARAQGGPDRHEAQTLVLQALDQPLQAFAWLLAHDDAQLNASARRSSMWALERRLKGEPLGYITGSKAFYGLELSVDARVLDPRASTETLVDRALEALVEAPTQQVLDLAGLRWRYRAGLATIASPLAGARQRRQ